MKKSKTSFSIHIYTKKISGKQYCSLGLPKCKLYFKNNSNHYAIL